MANKDAKEMHFLSDDISSQKKHRSAFKIPTSHLPDGTHRRKLQKIKKIVIRKAQLHKDLHRARKQENVDSESQSVTPTQATDISTITHEPHPDRQALMNASDDEPEPEEFEKIPRSNKRYAKSNPYQKETWEAQQRQEEINARTKAREEAQKQRIKKLEYRDRIRKAVIKARKPGRDGKRKLGHESYVLLEKAKKLMSNDG